MGFFLDPITFLTNWFNALLLSWGLAEGVVEFISYLVGSGLLATGAMLFVVFLIWLERKLLGRIQDRFGPNRVGPWGIFQTVADMLKIFTKEYITPVGADLLPFNLAPILAVSAVLMLWAVIPFSETFLGVDFNVAVLYIVAVGAVGEMGVVLAGWGSNNKFALLAAFRAVAQLVSYSAPMVISLLLPVMLSGSLSMNEIVKAQNVWFLWYAPVAALIFFISSVAEIGRAPFDLVEAESELVAGFNIEYSGLRFGMFYVADFLHAFTVSLLFAALFMGGWRGPGVGAFPMLGVFYFVLKSSVAYFAIILMRGSLPRFRIDQMMDLNWKILTPLSLLVLMVTAVLYKAFPDGMELARLVSLLVVNLLLLVVGGRVFQHYASRNRRRVVAPTVRPVAIYPRVSSKTQSGDGE